MSDINIYDISVGMYIKGVSVLIGILKKAALHPNADTLPSASLIDDMKPLTFQVQSVSNTVTISLKKLLQTDIKRWEDDETTMGQIMARAEKTLALLQEIDPKALEGRETTKIKMPGGLISGKQFVLGFALPNLFFHLQTAYAILRMKGVPLGKDDYLDPWSGI
ncbi:hypothetical protein QQS21_003958 [Conoideocrella luteorostrata]|uniref:DUF1993 domain-containing protein n=1 Tax=Conoideocrella luteorostrata TaxID=1105319 RepID=A0AAJ0FV37_9HYPO|nr:hypothetical protein QQS21_003958 [Conoideocrella luteorostrata]